MENHVSVPDRKHVTSKVAVTDVAASGLDLLVLSKHCADSTNAARFAVWITPANARVISMISSQYERHATIRAKCAGLVAWVVTSRVFVRLDIDVRAAFASLLQVRCR